MIGGILFVSTFVSSVVQNYSRSVLFHGRNEEFVDSLVIPYHDEMKCLYLSHSVSHLFPPVYLSPHYLLYLRLPSESNQRCMPR